MHQNVSSLLQKGRCGGGEGVRRAPLAAGKAGARVAQRRRGGGERASDIQGTASASETCKTWLGKYEAGC